MASNAKNIAELLNTDTTVKVGDLEDGSVTTAKLADDAVTVAKVGAGAIDATALASNAVTTAKVADGAVTQVKTTGVAGRVGRNIIINGAMNVAQRGTSETGLGASAKYSALDRFKAVLSSTAGRFTMSKDTDTPDDFGSCMKLDCTTADTSIAAAEVFLLQQPIEGQFVQQLKKGTSNAEQVTVSFYMKTNKAFTFLCELDDTDNNRFNSQQFTTSTSWTRHVLTFVGDTTGPMDNDNARSFQFGLFLHAGSNFTSGTYSANTWQSRQSTNVNRAVGCDSFFDSTDNVVRITGVQLEVGSSVTDFEHEDIGETLRKCQRYYVRAGGTNYASVFGVGGIANTTGSWFGFGTLPVPMRAGFSLTQSGGTPRIQNGQAGFNASSVSASLNNSNHSGISMGCNASGLTLYRWHNIDCGAGATLFEFNAEL